MTNAKEEVYMLTGYKQVASLRNMKPEPIVEMHPEAARKVGLSEGQLVSIETNKGKIVQRLALNDTLDPRIVVTSFGWWFPEQRSGIYGWDRSNINILTQRPSYEPGSYSRFKRHSLQSLQRRGLNWNHSAANSE
jgi:anaerobic selenocysteine-containing dehydrogenase